MKWIPCAFFATACFAQVTFPSLNSSPWLGQEILGRVSATSVTINVAFDIATQVLVEYGTESGVYTGRTALQTAPASIPVNLVLAGLSPNTRYYYRLQYGDGPSALTPRSEHSFTTQRPRGSTFTFVVQADPHMDNNSNPSVYRQTLANQLADKPDFLIDLGDTMMTDKLDADGVPVNGNARPNLAGILTRTQLLRSYYDLAAHSVPLFLALGNHEGEWGTHLNGTPDNFAIWDTVVRNSYFPNPSPDDFFSGDTQSYDLNGEVCLPGADTACGLGQRRSYYSWEWGDALFIVLDPFWSRTAGRDSSQAGSGLDCCQRGAGDWSLTLGQTQYNWLKQTLENSGATYKFVFSHNLVGGLNPVARGAEQGPMRGGVEAARYLEWGGYNLDGTWGFSTYRPNLPLPIHQLLVANNVTAFFHGHDHLYAHQNLDGIAYQEVPQPSANNANLGTRATDYGYTQGTLLGGRGYLRVTVAPSGVKVEYVETWLPAEERGTQRNGVVADSYVLAPTPPAPPPASALVLSSPAVAEGGSLPMDYTCDGTGSTLPLQWNGAPPGTQEFALLMSTLPGDGSTKWNWVLYRIPSTVTSLKKDSFLIGTTGVGSDGPGMVYNPPCSQGPGAKTYTYTLYALSGAPALTARPNQVDGKVLSDAIQAVTLASASLNVTYSRNGGPGSSAPCLLIRNSLNASRSGTASASCDGTFAYISSLGIPTATMMNGITSTNLQVPTPQNFQGANGWKIPLSPSLAPAPTNVIDGPVGVAINGVPIFNPCTQGGANCATTGDTKAIGQLDVCNGHAGRADDYHYHAAPTCMMADQPRNYWDTHPLGWALDGFAIFGYNDADGTVAVRNAPCGGNTKAVPNAPAGYAYHVTDTYPYIMNCLAGVPSPDLPNQASKYRPFRPPPVTPFNVTGMALTTDSEGYQVLQFTSAVNFTSTGTGSDQYRNPPGTYRIRYKQVTGDALASLLAQRQNANASACWLFQFLNAGGAESQPAISYCR